MRFFGVKNYGVKIAPHFFRLGLGCGYLKNVTKYLSQKIEFKIN